MSRMPQRFPYMSPVGFFVTRDLLRKAVPAFWNHAPTRLESETASRKPAARVPRTRRISGNLLHGSFGVYDCKTEGIVTHLCPHPASQALNDFARGSGAVSNDRSPAVGSSWINEPSFDQ
jgi:hypothetical protein